MITSWKLNARISRNGRAGPGDPTRSITRRRASARPSGAEKRKSAGSPGPRAYAQSRMATGEHARASFAAGPSIPRERERSHGRISIRSVIRRRASPVGSCGPALRGSVILYLHQSLGRSHGCRCAQPTLVSSGRSAPSICCPLCTAPDTSPISAAMTSSTSSKDRTPVS